MNVIVPKPVNLISSDVAEADAPVYASGTTYALNDLVMYNHRVYRSLQAGNVGKTPGVASSALLWSDQWATNRYKMFDATVNTQTVAAGTSMAVVLDFGLCTGFSAFMIDADQVIATVKDGGGTTVWTETISLTDNQPIGDWLEYFFLPPAAATDITRTGLPVYGTSTLTLAFSRASDTVKCGHCSIGSVASVGLTKWGVQAGINSYGRKDIDDYGNAYLAPGRYAKRVVLSAHVLNGQIDAVHRLLSALRETPCTWICDNTDSGLQALTVFGFWKDWQIEIPGPQMSDLSLEIEGMV